MVDNYITSKGCDIWGITVLKMFEVIPKLLKNIMNTFCKKIFKLVYVASSTEK